MTASLFALTRVPPAMGRALQPADEVRGAPDVAVIGDGFWRNRLGGARDVVGTTIRIAGVPTTIVGVMPDGFAMPSTQQLWLPLRHRAVDYTDGLGPPVWMYGRLADGVSPAQARAEVQAVNLQTVRNVRPNPVRPDVVAFSTVEVQEPQGAVIQLLLTITQAVPVLLLLIACGNAAILILARTAARSGEVALRTVLGASRARIMGQLFVETLLLALLATGIGLFVIDMTVDRLAPRFTLPFWFDPGITAVFVLKALGVSVLCAVVAGVLPALRVTGSTLQRTLQSAGTGGGGTLRLGRVAGALIIIEVGLGVAAMFAGGVIWRAFQPNPDAHTRAAEPGRYLVASVRIPRSELNVPDEKGDDEALRVRLATLQEELGRRLASQSAVRRWTFSDQPPGEEADERLVRVEGDAYPANHRGLPGVVTLIDPTFFGVLDVSPVSGRLFGPEDVPLDPAVEPASVVVNMKFLERRGMQPQSAIGARIRFLRGSDGEPGPWKEIVGVVPNIEPSEDRVLADGTPVVFMPAAPGGLNPMTLTLDVRNEPLAFAPRLRSLVAEADPSAVVEEVYALDDLPTEVNVFSIGMSVMTGLSLLATLLSTTALYALMSMTVAQRRREIGIRLALGGSVAGVMTTVARRALVQIAVGVTLGAGFWVAVMTLLLRGGELERVLGGWPFMLGGTAAVVIAIGLAASLGPMVRYVRMPPVETLRVDG
jgi:predicted permease